MTVVPPLCKELFGNTPYLYSDTELVIRYPIRITSEVRTFLLYMLVQKVSCKAIRICLHTRIPPLPSSLSCITKRTILTH